MQNEMKQLVETIKDKFPANAEFKINSNIVGIFWKLNNDTSRPNKRSRIIKLIISREFQEDYCDGNDITKKAMACRFTSFIDQKYSQYNPDHCLPHGSPEPEEEWIL